MKQLVLKICSILTLAVMVFATIGYNIHLHYCFVQQEAIYSLGDAASHCEHCCNHHHEGLSEEEFIEHQKVMHFDGVCCCEDWVQSVQLNEQYVYAPTKSIVAAFLLEALSVCDVLQPNDVDCDRLAHQVPFKIPLHLLGQNRLILFSQLKICSDIS